MKPMYQLLLFVTLLLASCPGFGGEDHRKAIKAAIEAQYLQPISKAEQDAGIKASVSLEVKPAYGMQEDYKNSVGSVKVIANRKKGKALVLHQTDLYRKPSGIKTIVGWSTRFLSLDEAGLIILKPSLKTMYQEIVAFEDEKEAETFWKENTGELVRLLSREPYTFTEKGDALHDGFGFPVSESFEVVEILELSPPVSEYGQKVSTVKAVLQLKNPYPWAPKDSDYIYGSNKFTIHTKLYQTDEGWNLIPTASKLVKPST